MIQPVLKAASGVLFHSPNLVCFGSKPSREIAAHPSKLVELQKNLRSFERAESYLPNRVFLGDEHPEKLKEVARPWFDRTVPRSDGRKVFGSFVDEALFMALIAAADVFKNVCLVEGFWEDAYSQICESPLYKFLAKNTPPLLNQAQLRAEIDKGDGLPLFFGPSSNLIGRVRHGHNEDSSLTAPILLENLCAKVSAAIAIEEMLLRNQQLNRDKIDYVISCSEDAVGDRYQRGGGNLAKAIAEFARCNFASGLDVKNFCAAPVPAIVTGAALVHSGVFENVVVVGGSSLPKLGMKFLYHLEKKIPVLEDTQAAVAVWIGPDDGRSPIVNFGSVGRHPVYAGAGLDQQFKALVVEPLDRLGLGVSSVDKFVTELHNPEITLPANGGDIPERNYRMLAAVLASCGKIGREEMADFMKEKAVPGYAPTQGHIASALAYVPHALRGLTNGEMRRCFLIARASLFLGQMTQLSDGMSVLLERNPAQD